MIFITVGVFILVVSFVLALVSLVREQRAVGEEDQVPNTDQDQEQQAPEVKESLFSTSRKAQVQEVRNVPQASEALSADQTQPTQSQVTNGQIGQLGPNSPTPNQDNQGQSPSRESFFWEENQTLNADENQQVSEVPQVQEVREGLGDLDFSQNQSPLKGEVSIQDLVAKRQKDKSPS